MLRNPHKWTTLTAVYLSTLSAIALLQESLRASSVSSTPVQSIGFNPCRASSNGACGLLVSPKTKSNPAAKPLNNLSFFFFPYLYPFDCIPISIFVLQSWPPWLDSLYPLSRGCFVPLPFCTDTYIWLMPLSLEFLFCTYLGYPGAFDLVSAQTFRECPLSYWFRTRSPRPLINFMYILLSGFIVSWLQALYVGIWVLLSAI